MLSIYNGAGLKDHKSIFIQSGRYSHIGHIIIMELTKRRWLES